MSFSNDVKNEIIENKPLRVRFKQAQAYGLFLFARSFDGDDVSIATESEETARLYAWFVRGLAGKNTPMDETAQSRRGKTIYTVRLTQKLDRLRLLASLGHTAPVNPGLLTTSEHVQAFLGGAFLACGNLTDPKKSYHLEFVVKDPALCRELGLLLEDAVPGVRNSSRRGSHILYYKECAQIEDLLAMMGASKASLDMIEVEIVKGVRNKANRVTNCETANIDKLVKAASSQVEDIELIYRVLGEHSLPESLRQAAKLRLQNPELSLRQLAEEMPGSISRSGMHHRLDKLQKIAAKLREEMENRGGKGHV